MHVIWTSRTETTLYQSEKKKNENANLNMQYFFFITSDCICKIRKSVIKWICKCVWILTAMCFPLPSVRLIHIHSHSLQWAHKSQKHKLFLAIYLHHSAITWNINKPGSFHLQTAFLHLKFLGYLIWFRLIFSAKYFSFHGVFMKGILYTPATLHTFNQRPYHNYVLSQCL